MHPTARRYFLIGLCALIALTALIAISVSQRQWLMYQMLVITEGQPPALSDPAQEAPSTVWFDDYFTVEEIAPNTYAIGEPRYAQQNFNYLIVGADRALLFDAGSGLRDIRPVVQSLTTLPIVFLASHFHYDHVGNGVEFSQRAVVDLPYLRERATGNVLAFNEMEHLGPAEGFEVPTWEVDFWIAPGDTINLGGRQLLLVHTPGHSPESVSLFDATNNVLLSGDYLYPGPLYAFTPGASMGDYLATATKLLDDLNPTTVYYGAHRMAPPGPPRLDQSDVADLHTALLQIKESKLAGEGLWPKAFRVNDNLTILADPRPLQDWN